MAVADGLGLRAAKFLTGNLVPIVGGVVSDSLELAAGCSLLIKNALGAFAALGVILLCAYPALKILVVAFIYRLAAAFVQPLGRDRLAESLQEIGKTVMVIFATVAVVGLMFFFCPHHLDWFRKLDRGNALRRLWIAAQSLATSTEE